ncbi:MAG: non-heme iron oxygenase ferredoxin subunit [Spirochaetia bacterium]|nr:non-heme iron oxygenase ferredoxin subunit [Spirochaetia bacterium]
MSFHKVASVADVEENRILAVTTKIGPLALTRLNGEILAFKNACSHDENPLDDGRIDGEEIVCARHGARFNIRTGAVVKMPATSDIEVYPVQVSGNDVMVDLD